VPAMAAGTAIDGHMIVCVIGAAIRMAAAVAAFVTVIATPVAGGQIETADSMAGPDRWPTKGTPPRADYIGADACARCHPAQSKTQPMTSMARTASRAHNSEVLRGTNHLGFSRGGTEPRTTRQPRKARKRNGLTRHTMTTTS
jgi:cytochrome c553